MNFDHNKYKEHVPENCPPNTAKDNAFDQVFRLCLNNPPNSDDFLSHVELKKRFPPEKTCNAAGISIHTNIEDSERLRRFIPAYRKKGYVSKGQIPQGFGKTLATPTNGDTHHTFWVYRDKNQDLCNYFS
ncbi:hypothetical protein P9858_00875 [Niallia circulans]|uniref:hypothetical protein n=1 Tax=Niallia circulans TaxID=1397 RepID=UPI002E1A0F54|nr:hypothetical protein [Niallia circulans]